MMRHVRAFGMFWWDFLVGDTPEIAAGVLVILGVAFALRGHLTAGIIVVPTLVVGLLLWSVGRAAKAKDNQG